MKDNQTEKKQLEIARIASIIVKIIAILLVPFFNSFDSIYEAHGWFHSTFTPPLVVAVFLGIFWKRFTTPAVIATFTVGAFLMILGQMYPVLISPFSHGIELRPGRGYSYIGALYNIFVCAGVGIIVTIFTKQSSDKNLSGLTVFDVHKLKMMFKGSDVNELKGESILVNWELYDGDAKGKSYDEENSSDDITEKKDIVRFSKNDMESMNAKKGDLVYLEDSRWWLGGLKSIHGVFGEFHDEDGVVHINIDQRDSGQFIDGLTLKAEKEM